MDGKIFTTKGWLPEAEVELVLSVVEDDNEKVERTDKFLKSTREWVGNDVHVTLKKGLEGHGIQGLIG